MNHEQGKAMEPYGFIFGKDDKDPDQDLPLSRHDYTSYAPIASFYISDRFADIPWPTTEDWEAGESLTCNSHRKTGEAPIHDMVWHSAPS